MTKFRQIVLYPVPAATDQWRVIRTTNIQSVAAGVNISATELRKLHNNPLIDVVIVATPEVPA